MFKLRLQINKNLAHISELKKRLKDFSIPFADIADQWAKGNVQKFRKGIGKESTGVSQSESVNWAPLSQDMGTMSQEAKRAYFEGGISALMLTPYQRWKRKKGYPDRLMEASGSLRLALTSPDGFEKDISPNKIVFGKPRHEADANKVKYNWDTRRTVFLNLSDKNMIRQTLQRYLDLGSNYKSIMLDISAAKYAMEVEILK